MRFFVSTQSQLLIAFGFCVLAVCALLPVLWLLARFFGEAVEKGTPAEGEMACSNCKCKSVRPSFKSGILDFFLSVFGLVPYRCEVCYWRFYRRRSAVPRPANSNSPL